MFGMSASVTTRCVYCRISSLKINVIKSLTRSQPMSSWNTPSSSNNAGSINTRVSTSSITSNTPVLSSTELGTLNCSENVIGIFDPSFFIAKYIQIQEHSSCFVHYIIPLYASFFSINSDILPYPRLVLLFLETSNFPDIPYKVDLTDLYPAIQKRSSMLSRYISSRTVG